MACRTNLTIFGTMMKAYFLCACAKSGKILCLKQFTLLVLIAISVSGRIIPPIHIFPGQRFTYNPLEGGVEGAYFGCSSNGWIKTEFFVITDGHTT